MIFRWNGDSILKLCQLLKSFQCILLLFCVTAIAAQKGGGRKAAASESSPVRKAAALARKTVESSPIQQVLFNKN